MRLSTKLFIGFSAFAVLWQIFSLSYFVLAPAVLAAEDDKIDITGAIIRVPFWDLPSELKTFSFEPCPEECLPSDAHETCEAKKIKTCLNIPWIAMYIGAAFRYAVVLGSILAVLMIMLGGTLYLIGGINQNMIKTGKDFISGAVIGLILLLGSYILLNAINPNIVSLKPIKIEVAKEQALAKPLACSEAVQQGYVVDDPNWKTDTVCGAEKEIKYTGADPAKMVAGQKCRDDSCGNTGKACVQNVETGDYSCKSVAMYGKITYPETLTLAGCGKITEALTTKGFYVDELRLMKLTSSGQLIFVTANISVGAGKYLYSIEKSALGQFELSDKIFLWIEVNDADWSVWSLGMTSDDEFYAAAKTKDINAANVVVPITFCGADEEKNMFGVSPTEKGIMTYNIPALTGAQLKGAVKGIRWDIDITKDFFNCQSGKTAEALKVDCQYTVASGIGEKGDNCASNKVTCQQGLICNSKTKICSQPGTTNAKCGNDAECASGFYCRNDGVCDAVGTTAGLSCDTGNDKSCGAGLICTDESELQIVDKPICVQASKSCLNNNECQIGDWKGGECDKGYCDCDDDVECASGYICANNGGTLYNGNDTCVKKNNL